MALQIKSQGRGTARFQISGIQDSLYRAYSLVARRRRMSLNALLQEAVEEYMTARHKETWKECTEPENTDEEILAGIEVPISHHELDAEIERRALLKAREMFGGAGSSPRPTAPPQQQRQSNIRIDADPSAPRAVQEEVRKPWNPVGHFPGPFPGTPEAEEWEAAGRPGHIEWDAIQKAKKEAAAAPTPPPSPTDNLPGVVRKILLPPTSDPNYDAKSLELYQQAARAEEERLRRG